MGPAWFWLGQPRIAAQVKRFGLAVLEQYSTGLQTVEYGQGRVQRVRVFASMQGSLRLEGGLSVLTRRLADTLPDARKRLNTQVEGLCREDGQLVAHLVGGETLEADQVISALPMRVPANLKFEPALKYTTIAAMQGVSTWMACGRAGCILRERKSRQNLVASSRGLWKPLRRFCASFKVLAKIEPVKSFSAQTLE